MTTPDPTTPEAAVADPFIDSDQWPSALVRTTSALHGLLYTHIGDDGEWVVILGHPTREQVEVFMPALAEKLNQDTDLTDDYDDLSFTWARLLWSCPDHKTKARDCDFCRFIQPGVWWLDWAVPQGAPPDLNRDKAGYFPITVWSEW